MKPTCFQIFACFFLISCKSEIHVDIVSEKNSNPSNNNSSNTQISKTLSYGNGSLFFKNSELFTYKNSFFVTIDPPTLEDGGTSTSFTASGLPSGLSINATTGAISGTPTNEGLFTISVKATKDNFTYSGSITLKVLRDFENQRVSRNELVGSHIKNGNIFSSGDNRWSAFGDGTTTSSNTLTPLLKSNAINNERIKSYSSGSGHTCGLTVNNKFFCYGWGTEGQIGHGINAIEAEPVVLNFSSFTGYRIRNFNMGWSHSSAIISNFNDHRQDKLLTWGDGSFGVLGLGDYANQNTPQEITLSPNWPLQVVSSYDTTCVLLNNFTIKCTGKNDYGQLGNGTTTSTNTFTNVDLSTLSSDEYPIRLVESSGKFNGFFTNKSKFYMFGSNGTAQMGTGNYVDLLTPTEIAIPSKTIKDASLGRNHSLILTSDNILYTSGEGVYGAIGNGFTSPSTVFTQVDMRGSLLGENIIEIYAGYLDNAVITSTKKLFTWGGNTTGQAGNGTTAQNNSPILIDSDIEN